MIIFSLGNKTQCVFSLQHLTTPDPSDTSKDEMESLKQELEKWKASSIKRVESWKLDGRHLEGL